MLNDPRAEVDRQVVRSLAACPWRQPYRCYIDAVARDAVSVRKLAAEQAASRWRDHRRSRFPVKLRRPAAQRARRIADSLSAGVRRGSAGSANVETAPTRVGTTSVDGDQRVEQLIAFADFAALAAIAQTWSPR